jgi:hypothetical protein
MLIRYGKLPGPFVVIMTKLLRDSNHILPSQQLKMKRIQRSEYTMYYYDYTLWSNRFTISDLVIITCTLPPPTAILSYVCAF